MAPNKMLCIVITSILTLSVVMLNIVILIVVAPNCMLLLLSIVIIKHLAQYRYAYCCHTDCHGA
jgi:hypothetical protein